MSLHRFIMLAPVLAVLALLPFKSSCAEEPPPRTEQAELREKAERLRAEMKELAAAGNQDKAAAVEKRIDEIETRLSSERERSPQPNRPSHDRLAALKREIQGLREAGKVDEAERLEQRARRLSEARNGQQDHKLDRPGPIAGSPQADARRRIQHLRAAADNLRAIGKVEPADDLIREMKEIQRRFEGGPGMAMDSIEPKLRELQAQIDELRQEVRRLRARLDSSR